MQVKLFNPLCDLTRNVEVLLTDDTTRWVCEMSNEFVSLGDRDRRLESVN